MFSPLGYSNSLLHNFNTFIELFHLKPKKITWISDMLYNFCSVVYLFYLKCVHDSELTKKKKKVERKKNVLCVVPMEMNLVDVHVFWLLFNV